MKILINIFISLFLIISTATIQYCKNNEINQVVKKGKIRSDWSKFNSKSRIGKVVFAQPPDMYILNLNTGIKKKIQGIIVEGGPGRRNRGLTPRPFWSEDGKNFIYRYKKKVFFSDENGNKIEISNPIMKIVKESRWSLLWFEQKYWAVGPSNEGNVILVQIQDNTNLKTIYSGGNVKNWCEVTGNGKFVVFHDGSDTFVNESFSKKNGIKISTGQSCRPCAAPDNKVGWLPAPHIKYQIYDGKTGDFLFNINPPENEEIYRLNWSNHKNFAVHMYGSRGNNRMNIRKVHNGKNIFIGYGWDPDLWVEE